MRKDGRKVEKERNLGIGHSLIAEFELLSAGSRTRVRMKGIWIGVNSSRSQVYLLSVS
jgi:hypothetical protein